MEANDTKRILCVGIVCLDIVTVCDTFPKEDTKTRAIKMYKRRGGNASNSCTVLSEFGEKCEILSTVANSHELKFIEEDFAKYDILSSNCPILKADGFATSVVLINQKLSTRTIVNSRKGLRELCFEDFVRLDLSKYKWAHFEGRSDNIVEIQKMIDHIKKWNETNPVIGVSVEIETVKPQVAKLLPYGDAVFVSKDFAKFSGHMDMDSAAQYFATQATANAFVTCAWGSEGAAAKLPDGKIITVPAFPVGEVVDTLGAGDTFNACCVYALANKWPYEKCLEFACRVSGTKVSQEGFNGLKQVLEKF